MADALLRVVIADDSDMVRQVTRMHLERHARFEVVGEATDGREAVRMTHDLQPDLVLLDHSMPILDGIDAIPEVLDAAPGVKVVVMSGSADLGDRARAAGASGCVMKGGSPSAIIADLLRLIGAE